MIKVKDLVEYLNNYKEDDEISVEAGEDSGMKILTAKQVKRLEPGTDVFLVNDKTGSRGMVWIIKHGRKKMLRGIVTLHEIKDLEGWHYEIEEEQKDG